eukprot:363353-Chlamydomonas_euryale.AAC.16
MCAAAGGGATAVLSHAGTSAHRGSCPCLAVAAARLPHPFNVLLLLPTFLPGRPSTLNVFPLLASLPGRPPGPSMPFNSSTPPSLAVPLDPQCRSTPPHLPPWPSPRTTCQLLPFVQYQREGIETCFLAAHCNNVTAVAGPVSRLPCIMHMHEKPCTQAGCLVAGVEMDGQEVELRPAQWQRKLLSDLGLVGEPQQAAAEAGADLEVSFGGPQHVDARLLAAARVLMAKSQEEVAVRQTLVRACSCA